MIDGMLNYYMSIPDPDELSDEAYAEKFAVLEKIRTEERKASQKDQLALLSGSKKSKKHRR